MPTLSVFYGIIVAMYFFDTKQHNDPHIHVEYQGKNAAIRIPDGQVLSGSLPPSQLRMVQVWVELRKEDLLANWKLASEGRPTFKVEPLR